jgi:hypothetical protein
MQRIATGTAPVPGRADVIYKTITVNPMPDANPTDFVRQLRGATALNDLLIDAVIQGANVVVTLVDFELTKWTLQQMNQLPRFRHLLPDED